MRNVKLGLLVIVLGLFVVFSGPALAVSPDDIESGHIAEADGVTGQDTNTGTGIKTGHIQDGAVTSTKITDGAVTSGKIDDHTIARDDMGIDAVGGDVIAAGTVTSLHIKDGTIASADIEDGAVTDAKITGPISASKVSSTGLDADTVDGMHSSDLAPATHGHTTSDVTGLDAALAGKSDVSHNHDSSYADIAHDHGGVYHNPVHVVVVAKAGGEFTDPLTAIASITDASASNPYLLKIMPGIYDFGGNLLQMKPYVDIEGSGQNVTVLKAGLRVVWGEDNAEIRNLTIEAYSNGSEAHGIMCQSHAVSITDVTVIAWGGSINTGIDVNSAYAAATLNNVTIDLPNATGTNTGISIGEVVIDGVTIKDSSITVSGPGFGIKSWSPHFPVKVNNVSIAMEHTNGTGMRQDATSAIMNNVTISSAGTGFYSKGTAEIYQSRISGAVYAVNSLYSTLDVALTQIDGPISTFSDSWTCYSVFDGSFVARTCP